MNPLLPLLPLLLVATLAGLEPPSGILAVLPLQAELDHYGGSAVLIGSDGLALSLDEAVAASATMVTVVVPPGRHRQALVVRRGSRSTAVLLRVLDLPATTVPLTMGGASPVAVGSPIWTAGNTVGAVNLDGQCAISRGTVSGRYDLDPDMPPVRGRGGRVLSAYRGPVIEVDAAVNDGDQGGALLDDQGRLIGLTSLGEHRHRRLGTAIPIGVILADLGLPGGVALPPASPSLALVPQVLVAFARTSGLGNPEGIPRPPRLADDAPAWDRQRLQDWWDAYYHQQQVFFTDQPACALVVDAAAGLLLTAATNLHGDADEGRALLADGSQRIVHVVAVHEPLDLALLKSDRPLPGPSASFSSLVPAVGSSVRVIAPFADGLTATTGIVSVSGRRLHQDDRTFLQLDANANLSSLGGAVLDADGKVAGLVVMIGPRWDWPWFINSGVALAADAPAIAAALPGLRAGIGTTVPARLGLGLRLDTAPGGLRVAWVIPGTGAAAADLRVGDLLTAIEGRPIFSREALTRILVRQLPGDNVSVTLRRGDKELTVPVEIRTLPAPKPEEP